MIGTIFKFRDFFENKNFCMSVSFGSNNDTLDIKLVANRKLIIPKYQREIRWGEANVRELLRDLLDDTKYFGNIFISQEGDNFFIVDGQQRLSVLYIIFQTLYNDASEHEEVFELIDIENESCASFYSKNDLENCDDIYMQQSRYKLIHDTVDKFLAELDHKKMSHFKRNLFHSKINAIILQSNEAENAIRGFIDINVKGVKLDTEDIIKGYVFKHLGPSNAEHAWIELKKAYFETKKNFKELSDLDKYLLYTLSTLLKNGFGGIYGKIVLKTNFTLKTEFMLNGEIFDSCLNVFEVIYDADLIGKWLKVTTDYLRFLNKLLSSGIGCRSKSFRKFYGLDETNDSVLQLYYNFVRHLSSSSIDVDRLLSIYMFTCGYFGYFSSKKMAEKLIESTYFFSFVFSIASSRKGVDTFFDRELVKLESFSEALITSAYNALKNKAEVKFSYINSYIEQGKEHAAKMTVQQLAIIFECYKISKEGTDIHLDKKTANNIYGLSLEHFIVNDSKKYFEGVEPNVVWKKYPKGMTKVKNKAVNLMLIDADLNRKLGSHSIMKKIEMIEWNARKCDNFWDTKGCMLSKNYFYAVKNSLEKYKYNYTENHDDIFANIATEIYEQLRKNVFNSN